ncbi:glycosyltransferase involved in cell wall biosynthesis [Flavobacterium sp. CG_23.5]|uniref:glycosyltransferase family 2 protein n=1 Tax=Flavobacterium sp. CG_23.5 TaxID=2760708 RepID=UPI001AE586AA|nr:glycosyltransferase family 2 protein [Flavobacterium sp. CG_23.5]MBP2283042.1 glycosyltransferase involved in cell wall biosynthesis [Flavobacterium sp. CG_23.5]
MPTVSIILATYNRAEYILESLQSIQNQTFLDWECLIIDDGGIDNTAQLLEPILKEDHRFQYLKRTEYYQKGLPGSRNYGLDLAKGDYIIFFDDDDIAHPQNLELCVKELSDKDISFCRYIRDVFWGNFDYNFDYSREYTSFFIDKRDINKILKNELQFNSCAVMWTKECYIQHRYTEHLKYAEEWEVYARIITSVNKGISINKALYFGRKHEESITGDFGNRKSASLVSYADAIELVVDNLRKRKLLSNEIIRYFIQIALDYKEYKLFPRILSCLQLSTLEKWRWEFFYFQLPLRLYFYNIYIKWKKKRK